MQIYPELKDKPCPETKTIRKTVYLGKYDDDKVTNGIFKKAIVIILALIIVIALFG